MIQWELGQIQLTDYDQDDVLRAQPDGLGPEPRVGGYQVFHPLGVLARPSETQAGPGGKPLEGGGTTCLIGRDGTDVVVIPLGDPRDLTKLPLAKQGERIYYGSAANFVRCHADGKVTMFTTTDGTENGKSVYAQVKPDGFVVFAPWGKLTFDDNGFHMTHSSGARIDAGAIGGLPAPLDTLGSYIKLSAAMAQIEASVIAMGTATGLSDNAVKATPLLAVLTAMQAALVAMIPALVPGGAAAAAAAAVTAAAAQLAASIATMPSSTTVT